MVWNLSFSNPSWRGCSGGCPRIELPWRRLRGSLARNPWQTLEKSDQGVHWCAHPWTSVNCTLCWSVQSLSSAVTRHLVPFEGMGKPFNVTLRQSPGRHRWHRWLEAWSHIFEFLAEGGYSNLPNKNRALFIRTSFYWLPLGKSQLDRDRCTSGCNQFAFSLLNSLICCTKLSSAMLWDLE